MMQYPSKLVEEAVEAFAQLPGVGRKTALRYVLHLLRQDEATVKKFGVVFSRLRAELKYCKTCFNISDHDNCSICSKQNRDHGLVCVVEDVRDVMAIENTHQYAGVYHVLGGIISPMDGIGPNDLQIDSLVERVASGTVKEIIMALSTTMEGDTTNFFIYKKLKEFNIPVSTIARGISIGDELEYADEITLGRSIVNRVPYEKTFSARGN
ncbi:MAG TPA: recombination mediator RecR [Bacteroidia bacterium]|nr:recombination mediator RecR [Bacteroidia bacterium]